MAERKTPPTHTEDVQAILKSRAERVKPKRKQYPSEIRRNAGRIGATVDTDLVDRLRDICKAAGYENPDGSGQLASPVIEDLLRYAVGAFDAGDLAIVAEVTRGRLEGTAES